MLTASTKARRALDRGLGFLLMGALFAAPGTGPVAGRGVEALLSLANLRYGGLRLS